MLPPLGPNNAVRSCRYVDDTRASAVDDEWKKLVLRLNEVEIVVEPQCRIHRRGLLSPDFDSLQRHWAHFHMLFLRKRGGSSGVVRDVSSWKLISESASRELWSTIDSHSLPQWTTRSKRYRT